MKLAADWRLSREWINLSRPGSIFLRSFHSSRSWRKYNLFEGETFFGPFNLRSFFVGKFSKFCPLRARPIGTERASGICYQITSRAPHHILLWVETIKEVQCESRDLSTFLKWTNVFLLRFSFMWLEYNFREAKHILHCTATVVHNIFYESSHSLKWQFLEPVKSFIGILSSPIRLFAGSENFHFKECELS